jgi:hypothetical protein
MLEFVKTVYPQISTQVFADNTLEQIAVIRQRPRSQSPSLSTITFHLHPLTLTTSEIKQLWLEMEEFERGLNHDQIS